MLTIDRSDTLAGLSWKEHHNTYCCKAVFYRDEVDGGYTVIARNLPGVVSEGDTLQEAIANIIDAFTESLLSYTGNGERVPWGDASAVMADAVPERELHLLVKLDG